MEIPCWQQSPHASNNHVIFCVFPFRETTIRMTPALAMADGTDPDSLPVSRTGS
jgi:hypothetical protein